MKYLSDMIHELIQPLLPLEASKKDPRSMLLNDPQSQ